MKKYKILFNNPLIILFLSGFLLNIPFFVPHIITEIFAFFIIAPAFYSITKLDNMKRYSGGALFFGAWMIPTSYWYFNFMPIWLAVLSLSYFTLIANVFYISSFIRNKNIIGDFAIIIVTWLSLTYLRINLPITEDWWIPHLAYTQWQNISVLQIANLLGIYGIIFLILIINAILAYFWIKGKRSTSIIFVLLIIFIFLSGNFLIIKCSEGKGEQPVSLIAIQSSPKNGYLSSADLNDIKNLKQLTQTALEKIQNKSSKTIFVLWPENMITEESTEDLMNFAKENNIFLIFNRAEKTDTAPLNSVVMINNKGKMILKNYKIHKAPNEVISISESINNHIVINGLKITSSICYDLHYADLHERAFGNNLIFAPVDDDRFGRFMPYLHARDVIFRAIENRINILTASTNGPTLYVNKFGIIEKGPLEIYYEGYLIVETNI